VFVRTGLLTIKKCIFYFTHHYNYQISVLKSRSINQHETKILEQESKKNVKNKKRAFESNQIPLLNFW